MRQHSDISTRRQTTHATHTVRVHTITLYNNKNDSLWH